MTTPVNRTANGGTIGAFIRDVSDADVQRRIDQIQADRIDAWLDHAVYVTGVHKAALITALSMRADAATRDVDCEIIHEEAAKLARPGSPATPAQYHNGLRSRADSASSDDAFRQMLAKQLVDAAQPTTADAAADDEAFRQMLAAKAGGAE